MLCYQQAKIAFVGTIKGIFRNGIVIKSSIKVIADPISSQSAGIMLSLQVILTIVGILGAVLLAPFMWPLARYLLTRRRQRLARERQQDLEANIHALAQSVRDFIEHVTIQPPMAPPSEEAGDVHLSNMIAPAHVNTLVPSSAKPMPLARLSRLEGKNGDREVQNTPAEFVSEPDKDSNFNMALTDV
ncbi:hypothetical protein F5Y19DRAFT_73577 [Xylariaceae sp. FL1651]|nr:hypothetical protein F5Y19DRAFT_73577 [Xylariaceae sp. FL1651]